MQFKAFIQGLEEVSDPVRKRCRISARLNEKLGPEEELNK